MLGGKRVLIVGGEGVVLYNPSGKGVDRETAISWEVPNFEEQLVEALAERNSSKSVIVLFDDSSQAYKKEKIPANIGAFDKANFLKRKVGQLFPSHPVRAAMEVKPPKKKASFGLTLTKPDLPDPSYLFVALSELERLDVIGNALLESGVPVAGFGLLPIESEGLVSELAAKLFAKDGKRARWAVLVGQHESGGIRQVFVEGGNLAMTRVVRTDAANLSGAAWAAEVQESFKASVAYMSRSGLSPSEGIDLIVICGEIEKQFFDPAVLQVTGFRALTVAEALKTIGAKSFGLDKTGYGDALHAAWVSRKKSLALPMRVPSIHRIMAPRLAARVATGLMTLTAIGLAWIVFSDFQAYQGIKDDIDMRNNQRASLEREYADEAKVFDTLPVKPDVMKATLAIKDMLDRNTVDVAPLLNTLRAALGADISLHEIDYTHTPTTAFSFAPAGGGARSTVYVPPPAADDRGRIRVNFKFALPDNMVLEQKVIRAEKLQKDLQAAFPGYAVRIVAQFGRISRDGRMTGQLGGGDTRSGGGEDLAEFELEGAPL